MSKDEKRKFTVRDPRPATRQISGEISDFSSRLYFSDSASDPPNALRVDFVSMPDGAVRKDILASSALSEAESAQLVALLDKLLAGAFGG